VRWTLSVISLAARQIGYHVWLNPCYCSFSEKLGGIEMKIFAATAFALLGLIVAAPAWAQTPGDNPVINAYRQQGGGGTPTDNFMYNAYQQHGPGTPTDNFITQMMSPRPNSGISPYGQNDPSPSRSWRPYDLNDDQ
jgi:hypothetical protein